MGKVKYITYFLVFCVLVLVSNPVLAQSTKTIDSLQLLLKNSKDDTSKVLYTEKIARAYWAIENADMAEKYFNKSLLLAKKYLSENDNSIFVVTDEKLMGKKSEKEQTDEKIILMLKNAVLAAHVNTGVIHSKKGDYLNAIEHFQKAFDFSKKIGNKNAMAGLINNIGIVYESQGNYPKALKCYLESLKINEEINDTLGVGRAYANIGNVYLYQKDYEKALEYFMRGKDIMEQIKFDEGIVNTTHNIGLLYSEKNEDEKALTYYLKALEISKRIGNSYLIANDLSSIGGTYYNLKEYEKSLDFEKQAIEIREKIGDLDGIASSLITISKIYLKQNKINLALQFCNRSLKIATEIGSLTDIEESEKQLSKIYVQLNDHKKALEHYTLYIEARDSLSNEENTKRIMQAEMDYKIGKKENEIALLEKDKILQQEKIEKEKWVKNVYLGGFVLSILLLFGILFYVRIVRANKKINVEKKVIELEQKLLRSQMNPHFIFNSLGIIHEYIQKDKSQEAGDYLIKFSKLMRLILENSREEYVSLDKEVETLKHYLNLYQLVLQNSFKYNLVIDENIDPGGVSIPPMLAQPFIENAIKHGLANKKDGELTINFKKADETILFEVIDNGIGYSVSQALKNKEINGHISLATKIAHERLENINRGKKKKIQIHIADVIDELNVISGTKVEFEIPVLYTI